MVKSWVTILFIILQIWLIVLIRAASEMSEQNSSSIYADYQLDPLLKEITENHGYQDLKNCKYYFAGSFENSGQSVNQETAAQKCNNVSKSASLPLYLMQFVSDFHVKSMLNIFETGL